MNYFTNSPLPTSDLEDHPAPALGLEVAVDLPRALGQVGRVDQVDAGLGGAWGHSQRLAQLAVAESVRMAK